MARYPAPALFDLEEKPQLQRLLKSHLHGSSHAILGHRRPIATSGRTPDSDDSDIHASKINIGSPLRLPEGNYLAGDIPTSAIHSFSRTAQVE
jgi:hypothetical protein